MSDESGGNAPSGADRTSGESLLMRRTLLTALGTTTLLFSALAAGVPADAAPTASRASGLHAKRVCAAPSSAAVASCLSKVMVNGKGVVPRSATPATGAKTPSQLKD